MLKGYYIEKLDKDIFKSQGDLAKCEIRSFLDHKMDAKNLVGWNYGKSPNMVVKQEGNTIIADLTIDEDNANVKNWADKIELGVINSNSFIFLAHKTEVKRNGLTKENPAEVIYKTGELISIDGVFKGFYPDAVSTVLKSLIDEIDIEEQKMKEVKMENEKQKDLENNSEDQTVVKKEVNLENNTSEDSTIVKKDDNVINLSREEYDALLTQKAMAEERSIIQAQQLELIEKANQTYKDAPEFSIDDIQAKVFMGEKLSVEERAFELNYLKTEMESNPAIAQEYSILQIKDAVTSNGLDGTAEIHGLSLAKINKIGLEKNLDIIFPEADGARIVPLTNGFDSYQLDLIDANIRTIVPKAEREPAQILGSKSSYLLITPLSYREGFEINAFLPNLAAATLEETKALHNSYTLMHKQNFYKNMMGKVDKTYNPVNPKDYDGGLRDKAIITRPAGDLNFQDLDAVLNSNIANYGVKLISAAKIYMHTDTFNKLVEISRRDNNKYSTVFNGETGTYRGVKILFSDEYIDKPTDSTSAETYPAALIFDETKVMVGFTYKITDDITKVADTAIKTRYMNTRGWFGITDPGTKNKVIKKAAPARASRA